MHSGFGSECKNVPVLVPQHCASLPCITYQYVLITCVPVEEGLPAEHGSELFSYPLEKLLNGSGISNEGGGHLEAPRRDVADGSFDIVGDPFDKVGGVLVLDVEQLFVHLLHGHAAAEDAGDGQVAAVTGVASRHHVLGVEHLLGQLRDREGSASIAGQIGGDGGRSYLSTSIYLC